MAWTPKAMIELANDLVMAVTVLDESSETRGAIQQIANSLISEALVADPGLSEQVMQVATLKVDEAIADRNLVQSVVSNADGEAVTGLVDRDGKQLPGAQWDQHGRPTDGMMSIFANRGMLRSDEGLATSKAFVDALGAMTWLSIAPDGGFDHTTYTYIANRMHFAVADDPPWVYPGNFIIWVNATDLSIHRLEN